MKRYLYFITIVGAFLLGSRETVAQTELQGVINQNTILTKEKSPYRVMGDVFIESDVTLTAEPGVEIVFWDYYSIYVSGEFKTQGATGNPVKIYGQPVQGNTNVLWGGIVAEVLEAKITIISTEISNAEVAINYSKIQHSGTWSPPQLEARLSSFRTNFTGIAGHPKGIGGLISYCTFADNAVGVSGLSDTLAYNSNALFPTTDLEIENCTFNNNDIGVSRVLRLSFCGFVNNRKAAMMEGGQIANTHFLANDTGLVTHSSSTQDCRFESNDLAYYHLPLPYTLPPGAFVNYITLSTSSFRNNSKAVYIDTSSYIEAINCNRFMYNAIGLYLPSHFYLTSNTVPDSFKITMNTIIDGDTAVYISGLKPTRPASNPDSVMVRFITNRMENNNNFNFYNRSKNNFNLFRNYLDDSVSIEPRIFDGTDDTNVGYISYGIPKSIQFVTGGYNVEMKYEVIKSSGGTVVNPSTDTWFGQECVSANVGLKNPVNRDLFTAYPNPFSNVVTVKVPGEHTGKEITLRLYDIAGRMVLEKKPLADEVQVGEIQLLTEMFSKGLYILSIQSGTYTQTLKLVK